MINHIKADINRIVPNEPLTVLEVPINVAYKVFQFTIGERPPFYVMVTLIGKPLYTASIVEEGHKSLSFAITPWGAIRGAIIKHLGVSDAKI